jgi:hypothetical protein
MTDETKEKYIQKYLDFWTNLGVAVGGPVGLLVGVILGGVVFLFGACFLVGVSIAIPIWIGGQFGLSPPVSLLLWPVEMFALSMLILFVAKVTGRLKPDPVETRKPGQK